MADLVAQIMDILHGELSAGAEAIEGERNAAEKIADLVQGEKIAPVQGYAAGIPWAMHLRAYNAYCKRYGAQPAMIDLEGRNCRGGFSDRELDDFIPGWREELSGLARMRAAVANFVAQLIVKDDGGPEVYIRVQTIPTSVWAALLDVAVPRGHQQSAKQGD